MPSSGSLTQPAVVVALVVAGLAQPGTPPPSLFVAKLDFPLMVPVGGVVDFFFRVCLCMWRPVSRLAVRCQSEAEEEEEEGCSFI